MSTSAGRRCHRLADRLAGERQVRERLTSTVRSPAASRDLDVAFHGRLGDGRLVDLADGDDPKAKIKLAPPATTCSRSSTASWTSPRRGLARMSIKASPFDLLKLRKLL